MTSNEARKELAATMVARTAAVQTAESLTGRKATAAWRKVEELDSAVSFAARRVEHAVRAENLGADEAAVQLLARAA